MCSLTVSSKTTTYLLVLWYATFSVNVPYSPSFVVLCMKLYWNLCRPWSSTDFNEAIMYIKISLKDCSATFLYPKTGNSPALRMNCCALFTSRKWFWLIMILVTVDFKCFTVNYKIPVGIGDFVINGKYSWISAMLPGNCTFCSPNRSAGSLLTTTSSQVAPHHVWQQQLSHVEDHGISSISWPQSKCGAECGTFYMKCWFTFLLDSSKQRGNM